jgi:hypothetical protein
MSEAKVSSSTELPLYLLRAAKQADGKDYTLPFYDKTSLTTVAKAVLHPGSYSAHGYLCRHGLF